MSPLEFAGSHPRPQLQYSISVPGSTCPCLLVSLLALYPLLATYLVHILFAHKSCHQLSSLPTSLEPAIPPPCRLSPAPTPKPISTKPKRGKKGFHDCNPLAQRALPNVWVCGVLGLSKVTITLLKIHFHFMSDSCR